MTDREVVSALHQIGDLEGMTGSTSARFKAAAFHRAANELATVSTPLRAISNLTDVPHVGKAVAECVRELLKTGNCARLAVLRSTVTPTNEKDAALLRLDQKTYQGLMSMTRVRGLGLKKALALYQTTGIASFGELVKVAKSGRLLRNVDGASKKLVAAVLEAAAQKHDRVPLALVLPIIREFKARLLLLPGVQQVSEAGSARRRCETIGDLDLLAAVEPKHAEHVLYMFQHYVRKEFRGVAGEQKSRISWDLGAWGKLQIDLLVVPPAEWGAALNYFTGSRDFNISVRKVAKRRGYKISEHGYYKGTKRVGGAEEAGLFDVLHLPWVPPVQREGSDLSRTKAQPLIGSLCADWHVHTNWSDGTATPRVMVEAALARGLTMIGLTDHSYRVKRNFAAYVTALRRVQARYRDRISVLVGVEVDIRKDGTLELSDSQLDQLDFVIASIHRQHAEQVEARLLAAIAHPRVTIIGHPTGRQFATGKTARPLPSGVDWRKVFRAAAKTETALEVNAQPSRMDLPAHLLTQAAAAGCKFAVGSDAHDPDGVGRLAFALYAIRKAGVVLPQLLEEVVPCKG